MAEVARSRIGIATYLAPPGAIVSEAELAAVREMFHACTESNELQLVLDFTNVSLVSSALLELLYDTQETLARGGGSLRIVNASNIISDVIRLTELDNFIALIEGESSEGVETGRRHPRVVERGRLGDILVARGLVTEEQIVSTIAEQSLKGKWLGQLLIEEGLLPERELLKVLGQQFALNFIHLRLGVYDPEVARLLSKEEALKLGVVPLFRIRKNIFLATADPQSIPNFDLIEERLGLKVRPVLACAEEIAQTIREAHESDNDLSEFIGELDFSSDIEIVDQRLTEDYEFIDEKASGSPVINLINGLIQRAVHDGASDIHIEPSRSKCRVRFRIDGVLHEIMSPPPEIHPAIVSRLKVMSNLDIAERRMPQDGRIQVSTRGRTIDLRFSSLPGIFGEKVVLRVLDKSQSLTEIDKLGMSEQNLGTFRDLLVKSYGLLLVTGPTGSGKTTTLYAAISHLNSVEKSIVTIEDPVEYQLDVINQNQVREQIGLSFSKVLKHVLRQDPDIVMVGEIRERETAQIAVQAALTGHLVLSTLHTNDSAGAISRMLDMGVEPYLLSSALIGVIAQRLVRTVCPNCATTHVAPPGSLARYNVDDAKGVRMVRGRGCEQCYDSGYKGRMPIHELLVCDTSTQQLMVSDPSRDALAEHIRERKIATLLDAGIAQVLAGTTTVEEVTRVVNG